MKSLVIIALCLSSLSALSQLQPVKTGVYRWADHPVRKNEDRESRKILEGTSPHFKYLEIHATTQLPGSKPRSAHTNEDIEELVIVKEGTLKVTVEDKSTILGPAGVLLLIPKQMHSYENVGDGPLTYFVMRYQSRKPMDLERGNAEGGTLALNVDSLTFINKPRGGSRAYFDRATSMCERFEMHVTQLDMKGSSHDPHAHIETEIVLVLDGNTVMTIDGKEYQAGPGDFYFIESQLHHGIRNTTGNPCSYFAYKWN